MRKYGVQNFNFKILELCSNEKLSDREKYWISYFHSDINGYNNSDYSNCCAKLTQEEVNEIKELLKNTEIPTQSLASKYEVSASTISDINSGRIWNDNRDYPIRKIKSHRRLNNNKCKKCGKLIQDNSNYCEECVKIVYRTVDRPTREELKKLIREVPFTQIGKTYGVSDNSIRKWCDFENLPRTKKAINSYSDEEWEKI